MPSTTDHQDMRLRPQLSIVIPVFNEVENVAPLAQEIGNALRGRLSFEAIFVDDGSRDGTEEAIDKAAQNDPAVRVVRHPSNRGQSAAIRTGVIAAQAPVVAVIDGDGQNDPKDLVTLFGYLDSVPNLRMVVGERRNRQDGFIRRWSSRLANGIRARLLRDGIRDTGCGTKAFYREDFLALPPFDHMHRFLPALAQRNGLRVYSVPVNHRPRRHGKSKYGINNRLWVGITDLLGVMWLKKRAL